MKNVQIAPHLGSDSGFNYSDLPDAANHIRLLLVLRAEEGQKVDCDLSVWPTKSAPPYNAISYTWGDPASIATIILNGKQITVRENCQYVLRQAYWNNPDQHIWVDALCIDQSNTDEKNIQVAMMGQIYRSAERVLASVGPRADDSEYFMRDLKDNEHLYSEIPFKTRYADMLYPRTTASSLLDWHVCRWLWRGSLKRLCRAHSCMFDRPYFTRVWVVQELFMAKEITLCCGADKAPFDLLEGYLWMLRHVRSL